MKGLELKYFVLKPKGTDRYAVASRRAMLVYSDVIRKKNPLLADDLSKWALKEKKNALAIEAGV